MLKSLKPVAFAMALAGLATGSSAEELTADTVVATVNGTEITLGHMIMVRAGLPEQYLELPDDVLWKGILDQLVQQTVLAQTGEEAASNRLKLALENEERALRAAEAVEGIVEAATTEEAIQRVYDEQFANGAGMEFNAAHILVETEEDAARLSEEAKGGADFGALAREHSTGPSGPNGGDLGWFGEGMMVGPFEAAVKELKAGEVSGPVQTQFGWHVIKLNEVRAKEAPALDEVRAQIEQQVQGTAVESRITELVESADVTRKEAGDIDTKALQNLDLVTD